MFILAKRNIMEKLELKHLAPYLPYKLKVMGEYGKYEEVIGYENNHLLFEYGLGKIESLKPILRPLSDLSKNEFISELGHFTKTFKFNLDVTEYQFIIKMIKLHFDVFGLIEKGLAINKNTIK